MKLARSLPAARWRSRRRPWVRRRHEGEARRAATEAGSGTRQALIGLGAILTVLVSIAALSSRAGRETGLRADILSARRAEPGAEVAVTVSVRDTHGRVTGVEVDFGDGRVETLELTGERCGRPLTRSFDLTHRFEFTGYTTVAARVRTGGCGAKTETAEPIRTIQVKRVRR